MSHACCLLQSALTHCHLDLSSFRILPGLNWRYWTTNEMSTVSVQPQLAYCYCTNILARQHTLVCWLMNFAPLLDCHGTVCWLMNFAPLLGCHGTYNITRYQMRQEAMHGFHLMAKGGSNCQEETLFVYPWVSIRSQLLINLTKRVIGSAAWLGASTGTRGWTRRHYRH